MKCARFDATYDAVLDDLLTVIDRLRDDLPASAMRRP